MNFSTKLVLLLTVFLWIIGLTLGYFVEINLPFFGLHEMFAVNIFLLTIVFLLISVLFFGLFTPIPFLYLGIVQGTWLYASPTLTLLTAIPLLVAGITGTFLGQSIYLDLKGEKNIFLKKKSLISFVCISLVLALLVGFGAPYITITL